MAKVLVVANWKMNPASFSEARKLFDATRKAAERAKGVSVVVLPPAIFLRELSKSYRGRAIAFGLQNGHFEPAGAHTGEISMIQARDSKAGYALIGHAERRALGETNEDAKKKVAAALSAKMTPVLCVGETKRTASGEHFGIVKEQLHSGLGAISSASLARVIIVYEPLWAIGKDLAMTPRDMHEMAIFIRKTIVDLYGEQGHKIKILYGGSIDSKNAVAMLEGGDVHGLLVGRASAEASQISDLIKSISK